MKCDGRKAGIWNKILSNTTTERYYPLTVCLLVQVSISVTIVTLALLPPVYLQTCLITLSYLRVLPLQYTCQTKKKAIQHKLHIIRYKSTTCGLQRLNNRLVFSSRTPVTITRRGQDLETD